MDFLSIFFSELFGGFSSNRFRFSSKIETEDDLKKVLSTLENAIEEQGESTNSIETEHYVRVTHKIQTSKGEIEIFYDVPHDVYESCKERIKVNHSLSQLKSKLKKAVIDEDYKLAADLKKKIDKYTE